MKKFLVLLTTLSFLLTACSPFGRKAPTDVTYIDGKQIGIFDDWDWGELLRCENCGKDTPHSNEGNLVHRCTVCGTQRLPPGS